MPRGERMRHSFIGVSLGTVPAGGPSGCGPGLAGGAAQDPRVDLAREELAIGGAAEQLAVIGDDAPAENGDDGPARDLPAFPGAVVGDVEIVLRERLPDARVDDCEIGVAAL